MKKEMRVAAVSGHLAVLVSAPLCCVMAMNAVAAPSALATQVDQSAAAAVPVYTRARLVSVQKEADGRLLVRLKLLPRSKIPFSTQTFVAVDRAVLAGIQEGAWVKFTARSVEGENSLTSIHVVEECQRFQPCD